MSDHPVEIIHETATWTGLTESAIGIPAVLSVVLMLVGALTLVVSLDNTDTKTGRRRNKARFAWRPAIQIPALLCAAVGCFLTFFADSLVPQAPAEDVTAQAEHVEAQGTVEWIQDDDNRAEVRLAEAPGILLRFPHSDDRDRLVGREGLEITAHCQAPEGPDAPAVEDCRLGDAPATDWTAVIAPDNWLEKAPTEGEPTSVETSREPMNG